ncbi:MAG: hypothetical protein ACAI44_03045 [Candidatus Sericytochromatia bacterium]
MPDPRPFLILTPLGLASAEPARLLLEAGVQPARCLPLKPWSQVSNRLRGDIPTWRAQAFARAWQSNFPADQAELWLLSDDAYERALMIKPRLRSDLPELAFCLSPSTRQTVHHLYPFHLPERAELMAQAALLGILPE